MEGLTLSKFRKLAHMELYSRLEYVQILRRQVVTYEDIKNLEIRLDNFRLQKLDQQQRTFLGTLDLVHSIQLQRYKRHPDYWNAYMEGMTVQEYHNRQKESVWYKFFSFFRKKQKKQERPANQKTLPNPAEKYDPSDQPSLEESLLTNDNLYILQSQK